MYIRSNLRSGHWPYMGLISKAGTKDPKLNITRKPDASTRPVPYPA